MSLVDDKLETALKDRVNEEWSDKFKADKWKSSAFKVYTDNEDLAKIVVLEATETVAQGLDVELTKEQKINLQGQVTLDTTPEKILPEMSNAIAGAAPIEPA